MPDLSMMKIVRNLRKTDQMHITILTGYAVKNVMQSFYHVQPL
jgi:hypothetical protein